MIFLTSDLVEKKNGTFAFLRKYNLWHLREHLAYYKKRHEFEHGSYKATPTPSLMQGPANANVYNPTQTSDEISKSSIDDLDLTLDQKNDLTASIKEWKEGDIGAALNMMWVSMLFVLSVLSQDYSKVKTNKERRELYKNHISNSCRSLQKYSKRDDLMSTTKSAFDHVLVLSHRSSNHENIETPWNPLCIGFRKFPAPNIGVLGMFVAELFHVAETLFYVSAHTGILIFCYICTADGFCSRLNKNNWIFYGSPDGGKSFTSNQCKDLMLIAGTVLLTTHQSDRALDDKSQFDCRVIRDEGDPELTSNDPKFQKKRDEFKARTSSGQSTTLKKCQVIDPLTDIKVWKTMQIIALISVQQGMCTNDTELLHGKGDTAVMSRFAVTEIPIAKRLKGRRGVSDMNSAKQQQSMSKQRRANQYSGQYQYFDSLRFLIYKTMNLGILIQPEKNVFDMILNELKAYLKQIGVSVASRTEDRMYGKAVSFMILRILSALFLFPEEDSKLVIGGVPFTDEDHWKLPDSDFLKLRVHPEDLKKILDNVFEKDHFEDIRFVDPNGVTKATYYVDVGAEKAFDKDRNPKLKLRTMQESNSGTWNFYCPKSCVGKFYKQWVSIHHNNFEEFVQTISPMMVLSFEDTLAAMWLTRDEIVPDRQIMVENLFLDLANDVLKKERLRNSDDEKKRNKEFLQYKTNADQDSEQRTNYTFLLLGPLKEVVAQLQTNKNSKQRGFPEGTDIYLDKKCIRHQLLALRNVKDQQGYQYLGPSRVTDKTRTNEAEAFFGHVMLKSGEIPAWNVVARNGQKKQSFTEAAKSWKDSAGKDRAVPKTFSRATQNDKNDLAKAMYAKKQRQYPEGHVSDGLVKQVLATDNKQPELIVTEVNGKVRDTSLVYVNVNKIEQAWKSGKVHEMLEDSHPFIKFFKTLGYKHDGIKISKETAQKLIEEKEDLFEEMKRQNPEQEAAYHKVLQADRKRINGLITSNEWEQGRTVMLASGFVGTSVNENGIPQLRTSQPCISLSVKTPHRERDLFTENANVPSRHAANIIGINEADTKKETHDVRLPLNAQAYCKHLKKLCYFPDGVSESDFPQLYNYKVRPTNGAPSFYPFRWACPDEINRSIHRNYLKKNGEYEFKNHYPHNAVWEEEKMYTCKRIVKEDGSIVWVPYNSERMLNPEGNQLDQNILSQLSQDFEGTMYCVEDVQERRAQEESLARHAAQLNLQTVRQTVDTTTDIDVDQEGEKRANKRRHVASYDYTHMLPTSEEQAFAHYRAEVAEANNNIHRAESDPMVPMNVNSGSYSPGGEDNSWESHEVRARQSDFVSEGKKRCRLVDDEAGED